MDNIIHENNEIKSQKINQDLVNKELWDISSQLKKITNIKLNYIEYFSALLYIKYMQTPYDGIYEEDFLKIVSYGHLARIIDETLHEIRKITNYNKLFINIKFENIINDKNAIILGQVITRIKYLIKGIEKDRTDSKKIIAEAYQYSIMRAANNNEILSKNGEFHTPKGVVKTMTKLLEINSKSKIYDPACGSGAFLVEAAKGLDIEVSGEEDDISGYNICMTNLFLNGIDGKNIKTENIEKEHEYKYDYVITNPPFSYKNEIKEWDRETNYKYNITNSSTGYAKYLANMIERLGPNGKMTIILPNGILFRETEKSLRMKLIDDNLIDAIIGLPENLFPGTRIPVIVVVIKKNRENEGILFIDASKEYTSKRKNNILTIENQNKIVDTYKKFEEIQNYSHIANFEEIKLNEYNLSIKRYVKIKKEIERINRYEIEHQIFELENTRRELQEKIRKLINDNKIE